MRRERVLKPGKILNASVIRWPIKDNKFVVCVCGMYFDGHKMTDLRTSWVENLKEEQGKRFIETRNSIYEIGCDDIEWKILSDNLKDENLDLEHMKK